MLFFKRHKVVFIVLAGIAVGLGALFLYLLRFHTYLTNDPSACMNCHVMQPYYATWFHSSHSRNATCNDCHVPQDNFVKKWFTKAKDGGRHTAVFVTRCEDQVMKALPASSQVIMDNCIRCHQQLNTEFVNTGRVDYMMTEVGNGKACWDCHREVPHGGRNSLSNTPNALVPHPESPVPDWLQGLMGKKM